MKNTTLLSGLAALLLAGFSCTRQPDPGQAATAAATAGGGCEYLVVPETGIRDGGVQMITIDGGHKVWTKRFGSGRIKVLLLHGGPALTHEYMECFESFFPREGIEFYEYDQLGSYYSDQPTDSSLWTTARFVEEVEQVRKALGLEQFYLLGHSWGGILAIEYALKYQDHLAGLVISNMTASIPRYGAYNKNVLRAAMRKTLVDSLEGYEARGDLKNPVYVDLVNREFYTRHILRRPLEEWPEPVNRAFKHLNEKIYVMMQGPSEFKVGGRLLQWDRWNDMKNIRVPTLCIGARYDTMDPKDMEEMSKMAPKGRYHFCPEGSHCCFWDDQEHYFPGLIQFLKDADAGKI
jgi:proline iminopeptidase